ncbi:MAG: wax ester/triacylglycerol synthase domain-containing protein [Acidimicrobiales bacterium]
MAGRVDEFMRESDAFSWYMETDPALRSTIVAVAWLDRSPEWDTLMDRLERATRLVPIFRRRPVEPPGRLATPRWTLDPDFDLTWHLRRVASPPPHTPGTVIEMARLGAMSGFDTAHPLWEFTLVEGLTGGGAALVMKLHHSLTDGIGGMQLLLALFDTRSDSAPPQGPLPECPCESAHGTAELVSASILHEGRKIFGFVRNQANAAIPSMWRSGRHPVHSSRDAIEMLRSVGRTVAPVSNTLSPLMTGRSLRRRLAMLEIGLDDLKRASARGGGSVNDGFMAAVTGGFRRYHEHHGQSATELRVTLPISVRTAGDPAAGNRITLARFTVPVGIADPIARMKCIGVRCRAARDERSVPRSNTIAGVLNLLPPGAVGSMLKHVDFLASNVPGIAFPVYLAGARVTKYVPFGPTIGAAVNVTLLSYDGTCEIGVTVDAAAVPDIDIFMACLAQGFDEVLALGGAHTEVAS